MVAELVEIEAGFGREGIVNIAVQVYGYQTAAVVRAQWYLAAGVGGDGAVAEVGIAVGHTLAQDGVPEQHTGLCRGPGVVDNLVPQLAGINLLTHQRIGRVDRVLLHKRLAVAHTPHKLIRNLHAHIGTRNLALLQLGVDKLLGIGVLDADAQHQRTATAALCHLAGGVAVALHKGDDTCGGKGAVLHRAAGGTYMGQVVSHTAAAFHQLHLLLVHLHDPAIRVAGTAVAYHKAVRQRHHLEIVADARHGAALWNDIAEIFQQLIDGLLRHGIGVVALDAGKLRRQTVVHHIGVQLVNLVVVAQGIFIHPYIGCKFVAAKVFDGRFHNLIRLVLCIRLRPNVLIITTKI